MKNYYKILGIKSDATPDEINAAYEKLLDWQERFSGNYPVERKRDIDEACDVLIDPTSRAEFDAQLRQQTPHTESRHQTSQQSYETQVSRLPKQRNSMWTTRGVTGLVIIAITIAIRMCVRGDFFASEPSPTPLVFSTSRSSYSTSVPRPSTDPIHLPDAPTCTGTVNETTYGYSTNRKSIVSTIARGTRISYRPTRLSMWYELVGIISGDYILASAVTASSACGGQPDAQIGPNFCRVTSLADQTLNVYSEPEQDSEILGALTPGTTFMTFREDINWYAIKGATAKQFSTDGYVHSSGILILQCSDQFTTLPFGG